MDPRSRGHFWLTYYVASMCRPVRHHDDFGCRAEAIGCRRRMVMQRLAGWSKFSRLHTHSIGISHSETCYLPRRSQIIMRIGQLGRPFT